VQHSDRVVFVARNYGLPLQYNAELTGHHWPRSIEYWLYAGKGNGSCRLRSRYAALGFTPEYFVITHFDEYRKNHVDLQGYLESHFVCSPRPTNI
jgi:hypothetical protein